MMYKLIRTFLISGLLLSTAVTADISAQSEWYIDDYDTIESRDIAGNRVSFVCNTGRYDIFVSTKETLAAYGDTTRITIWASRHRRVTFYARTLDSKLFRIYLSDYNDQDGLINDLKDRYDLNVYIEGRYASRKIIFSLDGFADNYKRVCV